MENSEQQQSKLETLNREIALLSSQLKELSIKKEAKYREKEAGDSELISLIKSAQGLRDRKTKIDAEVRRLKEIRDANNKNLKDYYNKLAEQKAQQSPDRKNKPRLNCDAMRKQIDAMSYAIETEGLSFEKEQTYMDRIKHLKIHLAEIEKEDAKYAEARRLRAEITGKKKDADIAHEKIQELAAESTEVFTQLKEKSDSITKAKKARSAIQAEIKNLKAQLEEVDTKLVNVLAEWSEITKKEPVIAVLSEGASAMEQLRAKKRLTKEDILALQKQAMKRR